MMPLWGVCSDHVVPSRSEQVPDEQQMHSRFVVLRWR